ncbi:unnamed protein product, partial [Discosporangium mesarthrocarpum]
MAVVPEVNKRVLTHPLWLGQMTRACLIHSLNPMDEGRIVLRVSYQRPGWLRVGVEANWVAMQKCKGDGPGAGTGAGVLGKGEGEGRRGEGGWGVDCNGWSVWWVRSAALALGGEAGWSPSLDHSGARTLWFTVPAENIPEEDE